MPLVKVLWANHESFEATWELEQEMRGKYPYLFPSGMYQFRERNLLSGVVCKTSGIAGILGVLRQNEVSRMKLFLSGVVCKTLEIRFEIFAQLDRPRSSQPKSVPINHREILLIKFFIYFGKY